MMKKTAISLVALAVLAQPAAAQAQSQPAGATEEANATPLPGIQAARSRAAPAGRTDALLKGLEFDLEADEKEKTLSVQVGDTTIDHWRSSTSVGQWESSWLLRATAPFSTTDDLASSAPLDALSDGAKLTFNWSGLHFPSAAERFFAADGPFRSKIMREAYDECLVVEEDDSLCGTGLPTEEPDLDFARKYLDDARVNRSVFPGIFRIGAEGSIGLDQFEYLDPTNLEKKDPSELQASAALFFTYYPPDALSTFLARAEYQNAYEEADQQKVCKPIVVDPATDCVEDARLAPEHVEHVNLSLEYRRLFDLGIGRGMIGVSPRVTYDLLSDDVEAEFPLYFVPEGKGPIAPGISITYSSRDEGVRYAAFLKFAL